MVKKKETFLSKLKKKPLITQDNPLIQEKSDFGMFFFIQRFKTLKEIIKRNKSLKN